MKAKVLTEVERLERELAKAQAASTKASLARAALSPGGTRARVTTANARWARAAEHRDRISDLLDKARAASHGQESAAVDACTACGRPFDGVKVERLHGTDYCCDCVKTASGVVP